MKRRSCLHFTPVFVAEHEYRWLPPHHTAYPNPSRWEWP